MPWNTPSNVAPGDTLSSTKFNSETVGNLIYVFNGKGISSYVLNTTSYSRTGSTAWADVDAANLIITATVNTGRYCVDVTAGLISGGGTAANYAAYTVILDSTTRAGNTNYGLSMVSQAGFGQKSFRAIFTGLSVGSHTFKLQWRSNEAAGVATNPVANTAGLHYFITMIGMEF